MLAEVVYHLTAELWLEQADGWDLSWSPKFCKVRYLAYLRWCIGWLLVHLVDSPFKTCHWAFEGIKTTFQQNSKWLIDPKYVKLWKSKISEYKKNEGEHSYPIIYQWVAIYYRVRNLPAFKLSPNAMVDRTLRVRKAAKFEEASPNWIFLVQKNKIFKFMSKKGIGAPLTHTFRRNLGLSAKLIIKPPPRPLYISRVWISQGIEGMATFRGIKRSTLQPTSSTIHSHNNIQVSS